jgi:hypothetical protein
MSIWDFLSATNPTTLVILSVTLLGLLVGVNVALHRIARFVLEFAKLPKARRRDAITIARKALRR